MLNNNGVNRIYLVGNIYEDATNKVSINNPDTVYFPLLTVESYIKQGVGKKFEQVFHVLVPKSIMYSELESFLKGRLIHLEGRIQTHSVTDQQGCKVYHTEILVHRYVFLN